MKKIIIIKAIILLTAISIAKCSAADLIATIQGGANTNLSPFVSGQIGSRLNNGLGLGYSQTMFLLPSKPAYFGAFADFKINDYVLPTASIMYRLQTTDRYTSEGKENYWVLGGGVTFHLGEVAITAQYLNKQIMVGLGAWL